MLYVLRRVLYTVPVIWLARVAVFAISNSMLRSALLVMFSNFCACSPSEPIACSSDER